MIKEILINKRDYDELLTTSDPNINLVRDYLDKGQLFGYFIDDEPKAFIVIEIISGNIIIKNLLTLPKYRHHGYAKTLINYIEKEFCNFETMFISCANSSFETIAFYNHLEFRYSHRVENFYLNYYAKERIENDIQATDLLYFKKSITNSN